MGHAEGVQELTLGVGFIIVQSSCHKKFMKMLEILKESYIDLRPEVWAIIIVVAFIVIEVFQLGPHTFTSKQKDKIISKKKDKKSRSRHKKGPSNMYVKNVKKFKILVKCDGSFSLVEYTNIAEGNISLDFINLLSQMKFRSEPSIHARSAVLKHLNPGDLKNSVVACVDEAEEIVLDRFHDLWNDRENTKFSDIFFYSWRIPSIYALQKIVSFIENLPGANEVNVGVLYEMEEDVINHPGEKEEKEDYLCRYDITLMRRDPM